VQPTRRETELNAHPGLFENSLEVEFFGRIAGYIWKKSPGVHQVVLVACTKRLDRGRAILFAAAVLFGLIGGQRIRPTLPLLTLSEVLLASDRLSMGRFLLAVDEGSVDTNHENRRVGLTGNHGTGRRNHRWRDHEQALG